jgi:hypothetical protein
MDFHEIWYWKGILYFSIIFCVNNLLSVQPGTTPRITRSAYKRTQKQKHAKQGTNIKWNMSKGHAKEDHFHCDQGNNIIFQTPTTEIFNIGDK